MKDDKKEELKDDWVSKLPSEHSDEDQSESSNDVPVLNCPAPNTRYFEQRSRLTQVSECSLEESLVKQSSDFKPSTIDKKDFDSLTTPGNDVDSLFLQKYFGSELRGSYDSLNIFSPSVQI